MFWCDEWIEKRQYLQLHLDSPCWGEGGFVV